MEETNKTLALLKKDLTRTLKSNVQYLKDINVQGNTPGSTLIEV
jgi:hypothetical protein